MMNSVANGTRKSRQIVMTSLASALFMMSLPVQAEDFIYLGKTGEISSSAFAVNAAGDIVAGDTQDSAGIFHAYRWTQTKGMIFLGTLNGGRSSIAVGMSAAGDVIVGNARDGALGNALRGFRWTEATGMVSLGALNGGDESIVHGVNVTGDVVVGMARDGAAGNARRAYRWTLATGMVSLGTLNGGGEWPDIANGVNATGDVVVGTAFDGAVRSNRAFRWTQATGMVSLGSLNGGGGSQALDVNSAGDVVVGSAYDGAVGSIVEHAFRWTQAGGMEVIGTSDRQIETKARRVNAGGDVVIGDMTKKDSSSLTHAFRWTRATGMQSIEQWLSANGVAVTPSSGVHARWAYAVNADGSVVTGLLSNGHAYIARVAGSSGGADGLGDAHPNPGDTRIGSGLIDVPEFNMGLMNVSRISSQSVSNTDTALNGHYGTPMLLPEGRYRVWVGGVAGRQSTGRYDASLGLGEFGIAKSLSANTQLNFSIGGNYGKTNTGFGGQTIERSTYALPELLVRLPETSLYATVSGYYASGNTDINRGYLNAGTEVQSRGKASTYTLAGRLSLDWANAATWLGTDFSPYVSLTHVEHHTGAYTETGGGFPVAWNARAEHATTARLGTGMTHPLNDNLTLLGRAEVAHRFQTTSANVSGQVLGLYGFTLPGENTHQNWVQTGVGLESHMLDGIGSVMLHGSTQGQAPQYWISASYRKTF